MVTEGVIDLDTMPDHSDPSQTYVAEPTDAYVLGIIRFFFDWRGKLVLPH